MKRSPLSYLPIVALALLLSGCAASVNTSADTSYQDESFTQQNLTSGGLAILPVVAGENVEGYRRPFGQSINVAIDSLNRASGTNANVLTWQETMQVINDAGIAQDYQRAIEAYRTTSVLDREFLSQLQEATGTEYTLYLMLGRFSHEEQTVSGLFSSGTQGTVETAGVSAYSQVWDSELADVVWEAMTSVEARADSRFIQVMKDSQRNPHYLSREAADALATELFLATAR